MHMTHVIWRALVQNNMLTKIIANIEELTDILCIGSNSYMDSSNSCMDLVCSRCSSNDVGKRCCGITDCSNNSDHTNNRRTINYFSKQILRLSLLYKDH